MRNEINKHRHHDSRISYRGATASRLDNLTDAVFGIAITLLIFNLSNPNSFEDLLTFTKTLPAFLISISFIMLIWYEHMEFSEVYSLNDSRLTLLNTAFIALVIFYVYPLRFLTLFLTNFFFQTDIEVSISGNQVPQLMMYYGFVAFALYFVLYLFYARVLQIQSDLELNPFELLYTRLQKKRQFIMFIVPLCSIAITWLLQFYSVALASILGGMTYIAYTPLMLWWFKKYKKKTEQAP